MMLVAPKMLRVHVFKYSLTGSSPPKRLLKRNADNLYAKLTIQPNQYPVILLTRIVTAIVFRVAECQPIWSDLLPLQTNADCPSKRWDFW